MRRLPDGPDGPKENRVRVANGGRLHPLVYFLGWEPLSRSGGGKGRDCALGTTRGEVAEILQLRQTAPKPKRQRKPLVPAPYPEELTKEQRQKIAAFVRDNFPQYDHNRPGGTRCLVEDCLDYYRDKDEEHRDWIAVIRRWIRRAAKWDHERSGERGSVEKPQMARQKEPETDPRPLQELLEDAFEDLL